MANTYFTQDAFNTLMTPMDHAAYTRELFLNGEHDKAYYWYAAVDPNIRSSRLKKQEFLRALDRTILRRIISESANKPVANDKEIAIVWTHERIKDELPDVQVQIGKDIYPGKLTGRKNASATVTLYKTGRYRSGTDLLMTIEYSWNAIYNSLNTGKPLRG